MHRIQALKFLLLAVSLGLGSIQMSAAQTFPRYAESSQQAFHSAIGTKEYWAEYYDRAIVRYEALQNDIRSWFTQYLAGKALPDFSQVQKNLSEDPFLESKFKIASSSALLEATLEALNHGAGERLAKKILAARAGKKLLPLHLRVYEDEVEQNMPAYYERGTHKVKMALDHVDSKNWLTWFVHEQLHFLDPILNQNESTVSEPTRLEKIAAWTLAKKSDLSRDERAILNQYFSDLTHISIQAEWRDWVATSLFAQNALRTGLLKDVPPCLSFLVESGFGSRELTLAELKAIWWAKLKAGFYVDSTGLFAHEWLKSQLIDYVNSLEVRELPLRDLVELVN
jgi:hypothetical protein